MSDLVEYTTAHPAIELLRWGDAARSAFALAESLVQTNVCPPAFRGKPQEATAVILLGAELGISPIAALRSMYEIRGQIGMYVRAQVALVQSRGHQIWTEAESDDSVTVRGQRAGDTHVEEVTWTIARARQAGFIRRGARGEPSQYELQPRTMLWSRAAGEIARRIAADVLAGIPELDEPGESSQATRTASGRVLQRQQPQSQPRTVQDIELPTREDPAPPQESPSDARPADTVAPDEPPQLDDEPPPEEVDEDVEPLMTPAQLRKLQVLFVQAGVRGADARHAYLSHWLGRTVEASNDITVTEASDIIDRLERQVSTDAP